MIGLGDQEGRSFRFFRGKQRASHRAEVPDQLQQGLSGSRLDLVVVNDQLHNRASFTVIFLIISVSDQNNNLEL